MFLSYFASFFACLLVVASFFQSSFVKPSLLQTTLLSIVGPFSVFLALLLVSVVLKEHFDQVMSCN